MNRRKLYQWVKEEASKWQDLGRHERENIVVFSRGVACAASSQLRKIARYAGGKSNSQRRRLQRFVSKRQGMEPFFKAWTGSVLRALKVKEVVLIVDETKLRDKVGMMVVGIVVAGRCIPLAWRGYVANSAEGYPAEGQVGMIADLLKAIAPAIPTSHRVRVLADRGIGTSPALLREIMALGWTFLVRVTKQSKIILPDGQALCFYDQVQAPNQTYAASGKVFKKRGQIPAHVRVLWRPNSQEPWALVTNDPALSGWEYAQRMWIEEAFRDLKSHGWDCEQAALTDPHRVARLWILLVVAYAWMLLWGCYAQAHGLTQPTKRRKDGSRVRSISLFQEGRCAFLNHRVT